MEDGCENCPIDEAEEPLPLTAAEAQAILYGEYPIEEVFSDLCNEPLGEDFINDLAEKKDFCDEYVNYSCGGSCDELDYYLDAWKYIIDHIISGQITESTLDSWLEYFDECYYQEETTVEKWHKANWEWRIFHKMHRPFADMLDHSLCFPFANKV